MDAETDLQLNCSYSVPFLWMDARQGRERFGASTEAMPVRIRHVDPGSVEYVGRKIEGTDSSMFAHRIDGEIWHCQNGIPIPGLMAAGAGRLFIASIGGSVPHALLPTPLQMRRDAGGMRMAATLYPGEMAEARLRRVLAADYVQDGTFLYRRHGSRDPRTAFADRNLTVHRMDTDLVLEAGERALREHPSHLGLAERLGALRHLALRLYLDDLGPEDMPEARLRLGEAAEALASAHPVERVRKRMAGIARKIDAPREAGPDDGALAALAP